MRIFFIAKRFWESPPAYKEIKQALSKEIG